MQIYQLGDPPLGGKGVLIWFCARKDLTEVVMQFEFYLKYTLLINCQD